MTWYPECAATPEDDGPNFDPPVMGNGLSVQVRRLREAAAFTTVSKEARQFHERRARRYGVNTPRGLAHFKAAKAYTREGGRLQEMFENGGELGELPPKAIMHANKAAIAFHKTQAEKAGLDSDEGHAHIAAMEHHMDIHNKAKKQHQASKQQQMQASSEGGPGSGPRSKERKERAEKYKKQMKSKPPSYGEWIASLSDDRRDRKAKRDAGEKKEALPGHSGKQSPVPVPAKSEQPNEDIHQDLPPVPLKRLQQGNETYGAHAGRIRMSSEAVGAKPDHLEDCFPRRVKKLMKPNLVFRAHKLKMHSGRKGQESFEGGPGSGPHAASGLGKPFDRTMSRHASLVRKLNKTEDPSTRDKIKSAIRENLRSHQKKEAGGQGMVAQRYDQRHTEDFVAPQYADLQHGTEARKIRKGWPVRQKSMHRKMGDRIARHSMESRRGGRGDEDAPSSIDLKSLYTPPPRGDGWNGGISFSPRVPKQDSVVDGVTIKEF